MSEPSLLEQFLAMDGDVGVRRLLLDEIERHAGTRPDFRREFNFNCFDVYLDFNAAVARVELDWGKTEDDSCSIPIAEFEKALRNHGH